MARTLSYEQAHARAQRQLRDGVFEYPRGWAVERAVARHGYRLLKDDAPVGIVTSGSFSPSLERCIGMGYLRADVSAVGTEFDVEIRGQAQRARVAKTPFVPSHAKKI